MKRLKYMAVNHTIKADGEFQIIQGSHICGHRMLFCTTCHRIFCTDCDFIPGKINKCCTAAINAFWYDSERKMEKREAIKKEMAKRVKRGRPKFKVKLEEIPCGNRL